MTIIQLADVVVVVVVVVVDVDGGGGGRPFGFICSNAGELVQFCC